MLFISLDSLELPDENIDLSVGLEIRLDLCPVLDFEKIKNVLDTSLHPIMLTLRSQAHGGFFKGSRLEQEIIYLKLLSLQPHFLDVEIDTGDFFIQKLISNSEKTKIILSFHDFSESNLAIDLLYQKWEKLKAFHLKIAKKIKSSTQGLDLFYQKLKYPHLSLICMGQKYSFTRILGFSFGNFLNFSCLSKTLAPGQISYKELLEVYRYNTITEKTKIYALIGSPVDHSVGHLFHNDCFFQQNLDCRYIKIPILDEELLLFFSLVKKGRFHGFSVTMPLKETVLQFIDKLCLDSVQIGAVNTIKISNTNFLATNTDGKGAALTLEKEMDLKESQILILGAGGSAKAIAYELSKKGAHLTFYNRTIEKALNLQKLFSGEVLADLKKGGSFDAIINCLPPNVEIDVSLNLQSLIAFDISYNPKMTLFLQKMELNGARLLLGLQMFEHQALLQQTYWGC